MNYTENQIPDDLSFLLRNAESFDVWFFDSDIRADKFEFNSKYLDFQANKVRKNVDNRSREELISTFMKDIEKGGEPSRCWIPHHGIRAICNSQLLEIGVCFDCGWFRGQLLENQFWGTIPEVEECKSKTVFDVIFNTSEIYKKP